MPQNAGYSSPEEIVMREEESPGHGGGVSRISRSATIRDLLAYRIHGVANAISRSAAARYRREFDVTLGEWRTIALLAGYAPLALNQLARQAGVDRGQISRIVSGLTARGLVSRTQVNRGKPISLVLTNEGRKLYEGLFEAALERDDFFLGALSSDERLELDQTLKKLMAAARIAEQEEKAKAGRS